MDPFQEMPFNPEGQKVSENSRPPSATVAYMHDDTFAQIVLDGRHEYPDGFLRGNTSLAKVSFVVSRQRYGGLVLYV